MSLLKNLTPTEMKVAEMYTAGQTEMEIATHFNIKLNSVRGFLTRCRQKTNSPTNRALTLLVTSQQTEVENLRAVESYLPVGRRKFDEMEARSLQMAQARCI